MLVSAVNQYESHIYIYIYIYMYVCIYVIPLKLPSHSQDLFANLKNKNQNLEDHARVMKF